MSRSLDVPNTAKRGDLVQRPAKKSEYEERYLRERTVKRRAALATLARDTRSRHSLATSMPMRPSTRLFARAELNPRQHPLTLMCQLQHNSVYVEHVH